MLIITSVGWTVNSVGLRCAFYPIMKQKIGNKNNFKRIVI
jgi:hypothetical protein